MARSSEDESKQVQPLGNMDEVQKLFAKYDANGDGLISVEELRSILAALGYDMSQAELGHVMTEMDKNGDGFVDFKEFAEFHGRGAAGQGGCSRELRDAFDVYDIDKNGLISARELHAVLRRLGEKVCLKDCVRMISTVDSDGDGSVNFEEFKKMMSGAP